MKRCAAQCAMLVSAIAMVGIVTCQAKVPPADRPPTPVSAEPAPASATALPNATGVDGAVDAPNDASVASALDATDATKSRVRRVGTRTPGKVQCGAESEICDLASQVCCIHPEQDRGMCKPKAKGEADPCAGTHMPVQLQCDESSDCPQGQACCVLDLASGDVTAHTYQCSSFPCNVFEVCIPGGECSRPGFKCNPDGDLFFGDVCNIAEPHATCGNTTCTGKSPICCWDPGRKQTRCVASREECTEADAGIIENAIVFHCSSPADCGGYPCAARGMMGAPFEEYGCSSRWAAGDMGFSITCRSAADCPRYGGRKFKGCKSMSAGPAWAKSCWYDWGT